MLILVATLWLLAWINWLRYRDPLYPAFVHAVVWALALSFLALLREDFLPVGSMTLTIIGAGAAAFSAGVFVATHRHLPFRHKNTCQTAPGKLPAMLLLGLVLLVLPLMLYKAYTLASDGPFDLPLANLRHALSDGKEETGGYGPIFYFIIIAFFAAAVQVIRFLGPHPGNTRATLWLAILVAISYGILSSGRGVLLWAVFTLAMIPVVLRRISAGRAAFWLGVTGLAIFVLPGMMMGKGGNFATDVSENIDTMARSMELYLLASIPALDQVVTQGSPLDLGLNTFRAPIKLLHLMGFDLPVRPLIQDFVEVPMPTNIYTVYHPYFLDFGVMVLPSVQFILGFLHGTAYRGATTARPSPGFVYLYALSIFPLIFQFTSDNYFSASAVWAQYFLLTYLFMHRWTTPVKEAT